MKQTVTFKRTEIITLEIEVLQPLTKATLETQANAEGVLGAPEWAKTTRHQRSPWAASGIEPECECPQGLARKSKKRAR